MKVEKVPFLMTVKIRLVPLMLFNREAGTDSGTLCHTTLATARLRFLFVAAKVWRHAGRTGVSYSDHTKSAVCSSG